MLPCAKHSMELVARRLAVRTLSKFRETLTKQGLVAATAGEVRKGSNCEEPSVSKYLPGYPRKRTLLNTVGMSQRCQTRSREPYSITSSARASNVGGKSRPSALAVLRLRTRSYFDACSTGKSDGFSPF